MPYILRCRAEAAQSVRAAIREEIFYRGDFTPWNEDSSAQWFDVSADHAPLARKIFYIIKPWIVACYDGRQWLVPTPDGWRQQSA